MTQSKDFNRYVALMENTDLLGGSLWANCYYKMKYSKSQMTFELDQGAHFTHMGQPSKSMLQVSKCNRKVDIKKFKYKTTLN